MKHSFFVLLFFFSASMFSQAFSGKGDIKFQVGANVQNNGTGIMASLDFGVGENMSLGITSAYLLGVDEILNAEFIDRFDAKARFNANIGNVFNIDSNFDVYPGLYVSLKNFGGHLGARYFFTPGFGLFSEINIPIAKYDTTTLSSAEKLNNQFTVNVGASFNI